MLEKTKQNGVIVGSTVVDPAAKEVPDVANVSLIPRNVKQGRTGVVPRSRPKTAKLYLQEDPDQAPRGAA